MNNKDINDAVNHPKHYTNHPSGIECIQITEWMNFCLGNAVKYIWRAGLKSNDPIQDLEKARFYIDREITRLKQNNNRCEEDHDEFIKDNNSAGEEPQSHTDS